MSDTLPLTPLSCLADRYKAILCDVWGVVHNGVAAHRAAAEALARFRDDYRAPVLLITNAPRPSWAVTEQLDALGVPRAAYDGVLSSGDVTRDTLIARGVTRVHHLGPDRDLSLYEDTPIRLVAAEETDIVVCTGLFDDLTETPDDYRPLLIGLRERGARFVCANPDIVVERGDRLIYCAGALAAVYEQLGGAVEQFGKPHTAIYEAAFDRLSDMRGERVGPRDVLCIGDGLPTDVAGAAGAGCDVLFVTGGIHAADFGALDAPDPALVIQRIAENRTSVVGYVPKLVWQAAVEGIR